MSGDKTTETYSLR